MIIASPEINTSSVTTIVNDTEKVLYGPFSHAALLLFSVSNYGNCHCVTFKKFFLRSESYIIAHFSP